MHGLAELQHDEVRDVDDIVDGADACIFQPLRHPCGRRRDLDVLQDARGEAAAKLGHRYADLDEVRSPDGGVFFDANLGELRLASREHGGFAHKAQDAEAVAAVRRKLEFQDDAVESQDLARRNPYGRIGRQDVDAVLLLLCQLRFIELQFAGGAKHAVRHHAAQFALRNLQAVRQMRADERDGNDVAFMHVVRARLNRDKFLLPDIHLADEKMVGVGIRFKLFDASRDDLVQSAVRTHDILHGHARHRVFVGEFFRRLLEIYIVMKPFDRYLHETFPPPQN